MYRLILLTIAITATAVWAQDPPAEDELATVPEAEAVETLAEEDLDDFDIDSQDYTEDDEDVFKPTDIVSFEQSVVFPVDI